MPPAPRACIARMSAYIPGESAGPDAVKLNQNENPYPPSPEVARAVAAAAGRVGRYPDSRSNALRQAAAEVYGVPIESVMACNGSDEFLRLLFHVFADPGSTVAAFTPSYTYYKTLADMHDVELRLIPFPDDYSLPPPGDLARALAGVKILFLPNPNAPSGTLYSPEEILGLCDLLPDAVVCADEAYADFSGQTLLPRPAYRDNLVVTRTFSKGYGLAGLRAGLGFASPALMEAMEKARDYYNVDVLAQAGAEAALWDQAYLRETTARIVATRARLTRALSERGWRVWPSAANFVLARLPGGAARARNVFEELRRRRVFVRYFTAPRLDDCLRVTVGTDAETDRLFAALAEIA